MVGASAELTTAERAAAALVTGLSAATTVAYLIDQAGATIPPFLILALSSIAVAATAWLLPGRPSTDDAGAIAAVAVAIVVFLLLLSLSWPSLLPIGGGSDLAHHLQLIGFIEHHWRLPHDPSAVDLIGNMVNYTPGSHLLAALAGRWFGTDGLHALFPVMAFLIAVKATFVFLIARRLVPHEAARTPIALAAVALLALPYEYSLGSFVRWSFYAQVVSETFAVAMWWALVVWDVKRDAASAAVFAIAGVGAYLSWPVWIGPPAIAFMLAILLRPHATGNRAFAHACLAMLPIAAIALLHAAGRVSSLAIVQTGGAAFDWSVHRAGWTLLLLSASGAVLGLRAREARATLLFAAAIAAQTIALFAVAQASGADSPYMARKMAHLAVLPMAALSAITLAWICDRFPFHKPRLAWLALVILSIAAAREITRMPRYVPVITEELFLAGAWARDHAPPGCVDYLVRSDDSSYWLHHAVIGNPMRSSAGAPAPVFFYREAVARWITGGGQPFAIADLNIVPREVRDDIEPAVRFGSIVAGPRRGAAPCPHP